MNQDNFFSAPAFLFMEHFALLFSCRNSNLLQKSATYTCQVQGIGATTELNIHVEVVNKSVVPMCPAEGKFGVAWQMTSPGLEAVADCPFHSGGLASRQCRLLDVNTTSWLIPDFTGCLSSEIELIYSNVRVCCAPWDVRIMNK